MMKKYKYEMNILKSLIVTSIIAAIFFAMVYRFGFRTFDIVEQKEGYKILGYSLWIATVLNCVIYIFMGLGVIQYIVKSLRRKDK